MTLHLVRRKTEVIMWSSYKNRFTKLVLFKNHSVWLQKILQNVSKCIYTYIHAQLRIQVVSTKNL